MKEKYHSSLYLKASFTDFFLMILPVQVGHCSGILRSTDARPCDGELRGRSPRIQDTVLRCRWADVRAVSPHRTS